MTKKTERTGVSTLTDSELLILDMAATLGGCRKMYHPEVFPYRFNYPSHELTLTQVNDVLDRFEREGLITGDEFIDRFGNRDKEVLATHKGGELWETERNPDWSRYLDCRYQARDGKDRIRVSIYGHSGKVCKDYFDAACDSGVLDYRGGRICHAVGCRPLIWWRPTQTVYMLSAWLESWTCRPDWSNLEMKRSWWYSPDEISKFWGWPPAPN